MSRPNHTSVPALPPRRTIRPLPPYSYVPRRFPHPIRDPGGHSYGQAEPELDPSDHESVRRQHDWAVDLFNSGYYWEAHETWEAIWHAYGRRGPEATLVKALIKLAAAGVKAREPKPEGVRRHARRAAELFRSLDNGPLERRVLNVGSPIRTLARQCDRLAEHPNSWLNAAPAPVARVLPISLELTPDRDRE